MGPICVNTADCPADQVCIEGTCRADADFVEIEPRAKPKPKPKPGGVTFAPYEPPPAVTFAPEPARPEPTPDRPITIRPPFVLKGVHPFGGLVLTIGAGVPVGGLAQSYDRMSAGGEFLFAFRGGVLVDRHEIAIEVSPGTFGMDSHVYAHDTPGCRSPYGYGYGYGYGQCNGGPVVQGVGTYRYLFHLGGGKTSEVFWPIGGGIGVMKDISSELAYFQARADLLGVTIRSDRLMIDIFLPSFRYAVTQGMLAVSDPSWTPNCRTKGNVVPCAAATIHMLSWFFGAGVSYVF